MGVCSKTKQELKADFGGRPRRAARYHGKTDEFSQGSIAGWGWSGAGRKGLGPSVSETAYLTHGVENQGPVL